MEGWMAGWLEGWKDGGKSSNVWFSLHNFQVSPSITIECVTCTGCENRTLLLNWPRYKSASEWKCHMTSDNMMTCQPFFAGLS